MSLLEIIDPGRQAKSQTQIQAFNFDGAELRTVSIDGEPWFVAADVCAALDLENPTRAIERLDEDEHTLISIQGASNGQPVNGVNESGLYSLILGSRKPEAKRFKKWVTSEVLPAIRKTGSYNGPVIDPMKVLNDPAAMRGLLLVYTEKVLSLESTVAAQAPKVGAFDRISTIGDGSMCLMNSAKTLQMQPKKFFAWLQERNWIYRRAGGSGWVGYQDKIKAGMLEHKITTIERTDGTSKVCEQVLLTARGVGQAGSGRRR